MIVDGWKIAEQLVLDSGHGWPLQRSVEPIGDSGLAWLFCNSREINNGVVTYDSVLLEGPPEAESHGILWLGGGREPEYLGKPLPIEGEEIRVFTRGFFPDRQAHVTYKVNNRRGETSLLFMKPKSREMALCRFEAGGNYHLVRTEGRRLILEFRDPWRYYAPLVDLKPEVTLDLDALPWHSFETHFGLYGRGRDHRPRPAYYDLPLPADLVDPKDW